jgi:hypothetical protein
MDLRIRIHTKMSWIRNTGDRNDEDGDGEPRRKKIKLEPLEESAAAVAAAGSAGEARGEEESRKRKFGPIWMIPHLVKGLRFLQTKILQVRETEDR